MYFWSINQLVYDLFPQLSQILKWSFKKKLLLTERSQRGFIDVAWSKYFVVLKNAGSCCLLVEGYNFFFKCQNQLIDTNLDYIGIFWAWKKLENIYLEWLSHHETENILGRLFQKHIKKDSKLSKKDQIWWLQFWISS